MDSVSHKTLHAAELQECAQNAKPTSLYCHETKEVINSIVMLNKNKLVTIFPCFLEMHEGTSIIKIENWTSGNIKRM